MDERERREALAAFLRARRVRLRPSDVGLPLRARRRTPGLRREEVAELANIGTSWYTLLEQGQDVHPSRQVLSSLSYALRLTAAEERHLFLLADEEWTGKKVVEEKQVTPSLQRIVDALNPHPALLLGQRWDALAWNCAAELVFDLREPCPPYSRNMIWRLFHYGNCLFSRDWEKYAQSVLAQLRADYARCSDDASFRAMIEDLRQAFPQFERWWDQQNVRSLPEGPRIVTHPILGQLEFDHVVFQTAFSPDMRVKVYSASPATITRLEQALSSASY